MSMLLDTPFFSISWEFILGILGIVLLVWIIDKITNRKK